MIQTLNCSGVSHGSNVVSLMDACNLYAHLDVLNLHKLIQAVF